MKNSLFQVAKRHRVERCLFSLFCLCVAWASPFAASGYAILHDDYGERVGYERTGLSNERLTVAIRYLDWDENAADQSLVKFSLENGYTTQLSLGSGGTLVGTTSAGSTNVSQVAFSLNHEGGMFFVQQGSYSEGLMLFSSTGEQICQFSFGWEGKDIESLSIGSLFTLQDVTIFDSCLTANEMATYASGALYTANRRWSNFSLENTCQFNYTGLKGFSFNFSVTNYISRCDIICSDSVSIRTFGIPIADANALPGYIVLSQQGVSVTGACTYVSRGAVLSRPSDPTIYRNLALASFGDRYIFFDATNNISVSFLDANGGETKCSCLCARNDDKKVNPILKITNIQMPLVDVCCEALKDFDPARQWFVLNGVSVTRSYVNTWLPQSDWSTVSGCREICAALTSPRAASPQSNGYSLLDSWVLGLDPTNAASVARLNLRQGAGNALKLGFENVKTNREAFVRQSYAIKHAATLEALESAEYSETGSELTVPLDEIESVQFYRGKISFDPL